MFLANLIYVVSHLILLHELSTAYIFASIFSGLDLYGLITGRGLIFQGFLRHLKRQQGTPSVTDKDFMTFYT